LVEVPSEQAEADGRPPGWYDDPDILGVRRYWDGTAWTDSRVTTEGIAYRVAEPTHATENGDHRPSALSMLLTAFLLVTGGVCIYVAQEYKPSLSNRLGLNGNSFVLSSSGEHAVMIAGVIFLFAGLVKLLLAFSR
jgi:hypothetical protein